jgi:NO-binding membrane sensor protein with MHYT domain/two-component sensor histidine kinase
VIVAVFGAWTALDLFRRVHSHVGGARRFWLFAASIAMGASIWSMHFVGMLGFDPGAPVTYALGLTLLSLAVAIIATCGAFFAASARGSTLRLLVAGFAMGGGICLMHYIGMAALRTDAALDYRAPFVLASLVIAVVASTAALLAVRADRSLALRLLGALILGCAIAGMHYTAMAGLVIGAPVHAMALEPGVPPQVLGLAIASCTVFILMMALLASLYDQRLNVIGALDAAEVGYWEMSLPDQTLHISPRGKALFGKDPHAPVTYADLIACLSPEDQLKRERTITPVFRDGGDYDVEYRLDLPTPRWVNIRGRVIAWRRGKPARMSGVMLDTTERRAAFTAVAEAETRQRILIDELNHRVKNTLATVQSIAWQTAKGAISIDEYRTRLESRLVALSKTHNILTARSWAAAHLHEILAAELSPYAEAQVQFEGPDILLTSREALSLGMVFHELTTNAAKHGALAHASGRLSVRWAATPETLTLTWTEETPGGAAPPTRRGFGSRLIESTIERELRGSLTMAFGDEGLRCVIAVKRAEPPPEGPA